MLMPKTVKVLYTFDDQNKTNCLARLPNALPIPVVAVDDATQIGVIELRTCIQAIVTARYAFTSLFSLHLLIIRPSPELISKLEHDFTVYAYDYSEYETPLVGQGMLSRVLASASPTPHAPASQSGTMITGRVCKNILGIFSNGVKETLEVKLKLVPVPTKVQNEYEKAMDSYRSLNRNMSESYVQDDASFTGTNFGQAMGNSSVAGPHLNSNGSRGNFELLHDMLTPDFGKGGDSFSNDDNLSQGMISRPGSAAPSQVSVQLNAPTNFDMSRPPSQASMRPQQYDPQYDQNFDDQSLEDGPARKRARLMQADWQGRSTFGGRAESLRVAASTAASIRTFRPSVDNPSINSDLAPRAPTPRPGEKFRMPSLPQPSALRRTSYTDMNSPLAMSEASFFDDVSQAASSPADIPSSPPVFMQDDFQPPSSPIIPELQMIHTDSGFQSDLPSEFPQSDLPMSGIPIPALNNRTIDSETARKEKWRQTRYKNNSEKDWNVSILQQPPTGAPERNSPDETSHRKAQSAMRIGNGSRKVAKGRKPRSHQSSTPKGSPPPGQMSSAAVASQTGTSQPGLSGEPSALDQLNGQRILPAAPSATRESSPNMEIQGPGFQQIVLPKRNPLSKQGKRPTASGSKRLNRSNTWAHPSSDVDGITINGIADTTEVGTPEPLAQDPENKAKPRSGSGAIRQRSIVNALERAVAAGETVKYCANCGAINTPTWRPWWIRVEYGTGEGIQTGDETSIHCIEPLAKDAEGKTMTYRVYKKWTALTTEERSSQMFEQLLLCNPCGDYIRKHKSHRPKELWEKSENPPKKPANPRNKKRKQDNPVFTSDTFPEAPAAEPSSCMAEPPMSDVYPSIEQQAQENSTSEDVTKSDMGPPPAPTGNSAGSWIQQDALTALQRAIQQSPARQIGSKESPIEVEDSQGTNSVRRVLFPSPRKSGEFKSLDDSAPNSKDSSSEKEVETTAIDTPSKAPTAPGGQAKLSEFEKTQTIIVESVEIEQPDKENCPPPIESDDSLASLFDFDSTEQSPRNARSLSQFLKTPTKSKTPRREPLGSIQNESEILSNNLLVTPARQVAASSSLPGTATKATGNSPFGLNQFLYSTADFSPSRLNISPNWLKNLNTPDLVRNANSGGFEFDNDFFNTLSSDMPMSSSPGLATGATFHSIFDFYEDSTATAAVVADSEKDPNVLQAQADAGANDSGAENQAQTSKGDQKGSPLSNRQIDPQLL
jgi:hypothetical protein